MSLLDTYPIIHSYSRAQALEDGVLIDVTETAREMGFQWPVAVTAAVWGMIEDIPPQFPWQDVKGRLWDVLWMARYGIQIFQGDADTVVYDLILATSENTPADEVEPTPDRYTTLQIALGLGDAGEPTLTIMRLDED